MTDPTTDTAAEHPSRRSHGPRRSEETHRAVLDAAEALLMEKGPAGVTFEAVARRAAAGKPTLYRWWPTRAALLFEIHERHKARVMPGGDHGTLAADLGAALAALWRFWRDTPAGRAYVAIIVEAQSDPALRATLAAQFAAPGFSLRAAFDRALARGEVADEAEVLALLELLFSLNWQRLLTARLDEADVPALLAALLGPRTRTAPAL